MKYAIIKIASKQYKVSVGEKIRIEKTNHEIDSEVVFKEVLMVVDGDDVEVGTPFVAETVTAKVLSHTKDKKVRVATYKSKSRSRKVKGHRHQYTQIEILAIGAQKSSKPAVKKAATPKKVAAKTPTAKKVSK